MNLLRKHWFDIGGILGIVILMVVISYSSELTHYQILMWLSLVALLFHQVEEYRIPGTFPGMVNCVMFHSDLPDRYPLNSNTSLIINVGIGWTIYMLAAIAGQQCVWLGMATILISLGNVVAHTFLFNIKGRTIYNAGLLTSWLLFVPCIYCFFKIISDEALATSWDYIVGIPLGIIVNIAGVFKPIKWLADRNTTFVFENSQLLRRDRKRSF